MIGFFKEKHLTYPSMVRKTVWESGMAWRLDEMLAAAAAEGEQ